MKVTLHSRSITTNAIHAVRRALSVAERSSRFVRNCSVLAVTRFAKHVARVVRDSRGAVSLDAPADCDRMKPPELVISEPTTFAGRSFTATDNATSSRRNDHTPLIQCGAAFRGVPRLGTADSHSVSRSRFAQFETAARF